MTSPVGRFVLMSVLLVTGCGAGPGEGGPIVDETVQPSDEPSDEPSARRATDPADEVGSGRWEVGVSGFRDGDIEGCLADPTVSASWVTASYPSSGMGLALMAGAGEADAERVADCLRTALPTNEVLVRWVAEAPPMPHGPPVTGALPAGPDPSAPLAPPAPPAPAPALPAPPPVDAD